MTTAPDLSPENLAAQSDPTPLADIFQAQALAAAARVQRHRPQSELADFAAAQENIRKLEDEKERCREHLDRFMESIPRRYRACCPAHPAISSWHEQLTEGGHDSITIFGPTGTGKTHDVYGALRLYAENACDQFLRPTIFHVTTADFLDITRGFDHDPRYPNPERYMKAAMTADVLFLDDLGVASTTDRTETILYRVFDFRWRNLLPMVVTSNLDPDALRDKIGDRLASRLVGMGRVIALEGTDHRRVRKTG